MTVPQVSVVVPVYNEAAGLPALFERLYVALDRLAVPYEVIFVDDGSRDTSAALLKDQFLRRPAGPGSDVGNRRGRSCLAIGRHRARR